MLFGWSTFCIRVAINYVAISEALGVSLSIVAAGVDADNVTCAVYFIGLFALAHKILFRGCKNTHGNII